MLEGVLADLAAQGAELDARVAGLTAEQWRTPTPAPGWDVATQVAHLAWTDEAAIAAASDERRWDELVLEALADPEHAVDVAAFGVAEAEPDQLLQRWRAGRAALLDTLRAVPSGEKLPWFGPPMSPTSMATARFMETWAHSLDVHEALGLRVEPTDRIRHVAHLGVRTRNFAFGVHGLEAPAGEFRVELTAPSGETWAWGPEDADQRVTGPALDFCLRVTQRVHRADTALVAVGPDADRWLDVAQCFAGQPGAGREVQR